MATATFTEAPPFRTRHAVCRVEEFPPGQRRFIKAGRFDICVFNVKGEFRALLNICPHELAPVCKGPVSGTTLPGAANEYRWGCEGEILRCPWHGWEFRLADGVSLHDPKCRVKTFETVVEHGEVFVVV